MSKARAFRLLRRFFFPLVLAASLLSFSPTSDPPAGASACCRDCDNGFASCQENCYASYPAGAQRDSCLAGCRSTNTNCLRHCEMCDEPPGETTLVRRSPDPPPPGYTICFVSYDCVITVTGPNSWTQTCTVTDVRCYQ